MRILTCYNDIVYPGIAKLVSRLVWDQETVRSSRTTRTNEKASLKSLISEMLFRVRFLCSISSFRLALTSSNSTGLGSLVRSTIIICCRTRRVNYIDLHIDTRIQKNSDLFGCTLLHLLCYMRVSIQCECGTIVAKHAGDRLCVYAALDC